MRITYTSDRLAVKACDILYDRRPIYHRQSTDIPPTINGQTHRSTYLGRCIDRCTWSIEVSVECWSICRPIYRPRGALTDKCNVTPSIFFSRILRSEALVYSSYFFRTAILRKLFDSRFLYKHFNFSSFCLLVKKASIMKWVTGVTQ